MIASGLAGRRNFTNVWGGGVFPGLGRNWGLAPDECSTRKGRGEEDCPGTKKTSWLKESASGKACEPEPSRTGKPSHLRNTGTRTDLRKTLSETDPPPQYSIGPTPWGLGGYPPGKWRPRSPAACPLLQIKQKW